MASIIAKILSHFTVTAKGSRWTGERHGWKYLAPRKLSDYWSIDSRAHTAHSLRDHVSPLSWFNRLRYYRVARFETIQTSHARQTTESPVVGHEGRQDRREEKRRDREREDCEASRRWSALDLASVRSLAGPSCSPVLICFLLPSRLPTVPLRRSLPRPSPPCSGKGGFQVAPGLLAAAAATRRQRDGACGLC